MLPRESKLVARGGHGDDASAHQLGNLHGGEPRTAGGAENRHGLARLEAAAVLQPVKGGAVGDGNGGSDLVAHRRPE